MRIRHCLLLVSLSALNTMCSSSDPAADGNTGVQLGAQAGASSAGAAAVAGAATAGASGGLSQAGAGGITLGGGAGGAGGALGASGASGAAAGGASGAGSSLPISPTPTSGCQAPRPDEAVQTWLPNKISVAGLPADQAAKFTDRTYYVRLPVAYDHAKAYPIVFYGPGCGASSSEATPMMDEIKNDAIHVFLLQKDACFSTGGYPSPEVPYFNQALDQIQAKYCTDKSRVFVSGFSSGAWLSNVLACGAGDRIRAIGTAAGGLNQSIVDGYKCPGNQKPDAAPGVGPSYLGGIFFTGANDTTNPAISTNKGDGLPNGVIAARDRLIKANGCDPNASEAWTNSFGADFCKIWKTGCTNGPVVYCVGPGVGHDNGAGKSNISNKGFWEFWRSLP